MALAWLSAIFLVGITLGAWIPPVSPWTLLAAGVAAVLAFLPPTRRFRLVLLLLAGFSFGIARAPHGPGIATPADLRYYNGRTIQIQGVVSAEPDVRDTGINYVVTADHLTIAGTTRLVSGRLALHEPSSVVLDYGNAISLTGHLASPTDHGVVPYRAVLARQGIFSQMQFARVIVTGTEWSPAMSRIMAARSALEHGIDDWLPEPEAALLIAITLGAHSASLGDLAHVLTVTGLIHIVAISGIKVALVAGMLYALARLFRRRLLALVLPIVALTGYVLLTGATVSGIRSAVMWALVFIAAYLGRRTVALVSLAVTVAAMVAIDPSLPWDTGFQLTALGTFAIILLAGPIARILGPVPSPIREALATTIAAQVGTFPVVAVGFHVLAGGAPLANALVLPLLPALIVLGFLLGALASVPLLAAPVAGLAFGLLQVAIWVAQTLARLPVSTPIRATSPVVVIGYYVCLVIVLALVIRFTGWAPRSPVPRHMREVGLATGVSLVALTVTLAHAQPAHGDRLYSLGTGSAQLLVAGSSTALIDGSPHPFALLEGLGHVLPFRTHTIDLVIVTDPRAANIVGLIDVLAHYRVSEVLDVGTEYPSTTYARWRGLLRTRHVPVYALRTGASLRLGDTSLQAEGPDGLYSNPRDCIGLVRIVSPRRSVLVLGESSRREQHEAAFRPVTLQADILSASGRYGLDRALTRLVHPRTTSTYAVHLPGGRFVPGGRVTWTQL